ncbi:hypothetical protein LTR37_000693 [Vermiconidia calcicola]|uniref:Uncharacterized protein n=1 Tax=Vermiconidia calcicola TaxID=1690605 RepID=A0ACC3NZL6_9PEZI|nr:hypothetical protein LTR37_000693 [Vermiconidia calcicola]
MAVLKPAMWRALHLQSVLRQPRAITFLRPLFYRQFHASCRLEVVKPFLLADIGEGITECQLIQWFVQPGARVEQFDKICEVQSDKASVEITSPFDGVIKKLHCDPDDMAITGKPLVDIDIEGEISDADAAQLGSGGEGGEGKDKAPRNEEIDEQEDESAKEADVEVTPGQNTEAENPAKTPPPSTSSPAPSSVSPDEPTSTPSSAPPAKSDMGSLATPAVRRLTREHDLDITKIKGTGRDGRVLKEDVDKHLSQQGQEQPEQPAPAESQVPSLSREDKKVPLSPVQSQMFKTMTRALNIPHFMYSTTADMGAISSIRQRLNTKAQSSDHKVTHLPFILKALSLSLQRHPLLNASLNASDPKKPELTYRVAHNFGVAINAPAGLLVPVLRDVQDLTINEIVSTLREMSDKARNNKLSPGDFSGATFTVSNIGSVGGGVVAPVITEPQVAILGIGRSKIVPAFDENDEIVKKEELVLSWSADHRVVDGAECARCAETLRSYLEDPGSMIVGLR